LATSLDATAAQVGAIGAGDAATTTLVAETRDLLLTLAARSRALASADATKSEEGPRGALSALYDAMKSGDATLHRLHARCPWPAARLPPLVIQKIVRARFGAFRKCYEDGLARNPKLEGRVSIRFVIGRDGRVSNAEDLDRRPPEVAEWVPRSPPPAVQVMRDEQVSACVVAGFRELVFPPPEGGGIVTVTYPIVFSPAG
jgi:hypothetical protein